MASYRKSRLKGLKGRALRGLFRRCFAWRLGEFIGGQLLAVDYPVDPTPRYRLGENAHPDLWQWFDGQREACADTLRSIAGCRSRLEAIPQASAEASAPQWGNGWFSALDGMALYALVARRAPARIIEVGSGHSTKFAVQAIHDYGLPTHVTSIDPNPRAEIDSLCDRIIRQPLERTDRSIFAELQAGDFLFIDSSHRVFTNSDVTTLFLDILPRLPPGVVVHLHDIFLPWDYPDEWRDRYYSEQYLLACWLLSGPKRCRLLLSNVFASFDPTLRRSVRESFTGSPLAHMLEAGFSTGGVRDVHGVSFWAEVA